LIEEVTKLIPDESIEISVETNKGFERQKSNSMVASARTIQKVLTEFNVDERPRWFEDCSASAGVYWMGFKGWKASSQ